MTTNSSTAPADAGLLHQIDPECAAHWDRIRASLPPLGEGYLAASIARPDYHPGRTLKEQARLQIAILERDLEEWREIERNGA